MRELFQGLSNDIPDLIKFMNGPDRPVLARLINYFSFDSRYCHPRELKAFWESLSESEKNYYRKCVVQRII
jgi:hypothetical protein